METQHVSHPSTKGYILVFVGLLILTTLTVALSYAGLPHGTAILLAGLIATAKCALIASFFMHLKFENKSIVAILLVALFFVAVLVFTLLPDIGFLN